MKRMYSSIEQDVDQNTLKIAKVTAKTLLSKRQPYGGAATVNAYSEGDYVEFELKGDWGKINDAEYIFLTGNVEEVVE